MSKSFSRVLIWLLVAGHQPEEVIGLLEVVVVLLAEVETVGGTSYLLDGSITPNSSRPLSAFVYCVTVVVSGDRDGDLDLIHRGRKSLSTFGAAGGLVSDELMVEVHEPTTVRLRTQQEDSEVPA